MANTAKKLNPGKDGTRCYHTVTFGNEYARNSRRHYYANITFIDEQIGRIIQTLKEKDMYNDALIVFISDHGDMMGDHYHWRKTYPYEGSTHVPYIVKWPSVDHVTPGKIRRSCRVT